MDPHNPQMPTGPEPAPQPTGPEPLMPPPAELPATPPPVAPTPLPPTPPPPAPVQPVASPAVPPTPPPPAAATPNLAEDVDVIEKEWVDAADKLVKTTREDPHTEEEAFENLQVDYLKKRYGKDIKKPADE